MIKFVSHIKKKDRGPGLSVLGTAIVRLDHVGVGDSGFAERRHCASLPFCPNGLNFSPSLLQLPDLHFQYSALSRNACLWEAVTIPSHFKLPSLPTFWCFPTLSSWAQDWFQGTLLAECLVRTQPGLVFLSVVFPREPRVCRLGASLVFLLQILLPNLLVRNVAMCRLGVRKMARRANAITSPHFWPGSLFLMSISCFCLVTELNCFSWGLIVLQEADQQRVPETHRHLMGLFPLHVRNDFPILCLHEHALWA